MSTDGAVTTDTATTADETLIRVVKGDPTPEEIAALVMILLAHPAPPPDAPPPSSAWSSHQRLVRTPLHPGPQAWRLSGR